MKLLKKTILPWKRRLALIPADGACKPKHKTWTESSLFRKILFSCLYKELLIHRVYWIKLGEGRRRSIYEEEWTTISMYSLQKKLCSGITLLFKTFVFCNNPYLDHGIFYLKKNQKIHAFKDIFWCDVPPKKKTIFLDLFLKNSRRGKEIAITGKPSICYRILWLVFHWEIVLAM